MRHQNLRMVQLTASTLFLILWVTTAQAQAQTCPAKIQYQKGSYTSQVGQWRSDPVGHLAPDDNSYAPQKVQIANGKVSCTYAAASTQRSRPPSVTLKFESDYSVKPVINSEYIGALIGNSDDAIPVLMCFLSANSSCKFEPDALNQQVNVTPFGAPK